MIWLASETRLEQLGDGLKWSSGNGENVRTHAKHEFYEGTMPWIEKMSLIQVSEN
jgi:hypothetical protein